MNTSGRLLVVACAFGILFGGCAWFKKTAPVVASDAKNIVVDCTKSEIAAKVPTVVGQINQILVDASKSSDSKQIAIDDLTGAGLDVLACAAREAFADLVRSNLFNAANPEIAANKDTMRAYLAAKQFRYADGFTVSGDGGAE